MPALHAAPPVRFRWMLPAIAGLLAVMPARAQYAPSMAAFQFSNGVHPTFDAVFPTTDDRTVARFWQDELKAISMRVTNKKELVGHVARIPAASPDTLQVLIAVERNKGAQQTVAHIAIFTTAGYVGPDSPERELGGCMDWVKQRTVTLQRQVAQAGITNGQRDLDHLNRGLDMLRREEQRADNSLHRARQRIEQATKDSTQAREQLALLDAPADTAGLDSTAMAAREKQRRKDLARWQDRADRSARTKQDMRKKVEDLQWALKKNKDDQAAKEQEVQRQEAVVRELREKMEAIR